MTWQLVLFYVVAVTGALNLLRMFAMVLAVEVHDFKAIKAQKEEIKQTKAKSYKPWITVIVPAYNEELTILSTLKSVLTNTYSYYDIVVVNDGSKDKTSRIVRAFIKNTKTRRKVSIVTQRNKGKAHALNNAIVNRSRGSLVMCLDADSTIASDALEKTAAHFVKHKEMQAMPSNVSVTSTTRLLLIAQKFEYFLSYRLKRGLSQIGIEYIVGGVGSTFRKKTLIKLGGYDTDTITEDIDMTLKILELGSKTRPIRYGYDVHTYTQGVKGFGDLVKQRYRWKYGRMQTFLKHKSLFFNKSKQHRKALTFYQLPYAVFGEFVLLVEPVLITGVLVAAFMSGAPYAVLLMAAFLTGYTIMAIVSDESVKTVREKVTMSAYSPLALVGFYTLTTVELFALLKCLKNIVKLKTSIDSSDSAWEHVKRYT